MAAVLVHFICGATGEGKTTYAIGLAEEIGGVRFSIDEWMTALFWMDSPQPIDPAWSLERVRRSADLIWRTGQAIAARGTPVILEIGLTTRGKRAEYAAAAAAAGIGCRFHYLDAPADERWRRVEQRNRSRGAAGQLTFAVDRAMFDFVETMWEPPSPEERASPDAVLAG